MNKFLKWAIGIAVVIQFLPYGHDHTNPPAHTEPAWNSPQTRELFHRACFDCHSNETTWPWYASIAPVSWQLQNDVDGGRRHLNFSEWPTGTAPRHAKDVSAEVKAGDMPPGIYLFMHSSAKLTDTEKAALLDGAEKSLGPQNTDLPDHNDRDEH